jgi:hypothetical protein
VSYVPTQIGDVLLAADAGSDDVFGAATALSGNGLVLAVGAQQWDSASNQGGVYTYDWDGSGWVARGSVLVASDAAADDNFGTSVSLNEDGTLLCVGAYLWEGAASGQGTVYTYYDNSGTWTQATTTLNLVAGDALANDEFGAGCALSGDGLVLAVGATGVHTNNYGKVYIYDRSGTAASYVWTQRGTISASDQGTTDSFGSGVALTYYGDTLVVGAHLWDGAQTDQGGVYTYDWTGATWAMRGSVLTAPTPQNGAAFGSFISISREKTNPDTGLNPADGVKLAVGSYSYDGIYLHQGDVNFYDLVDLEWVWRNQLTRTPPAYNENFSRPAMDGAGDIVVVGAYRYGLNTGGVFTYALEDGMLPGATGYLTLGAVAASGTGGVVKMLSGAVELPSVAAEGTALNTALLSGNVTLPTTTVAGTGLVGNVATGDVQLPTLRTTGEGGPQYAEVVLPRLEIEATLFIGLVASGAARIPLLQADGEGSVTLIGTGALRLQALDAVGSALLGSVLRGTVVLPAANADGTGAFGCDGTASITMPSMEVDGVALVGFIGSGGVRLHKPRVEGRGSWPRY